MPRPKSEITKNRVFVGMWMTPAQKEMFQTLGGVQWLRNKINREIRSEEISLGIPLCTETKTSSNSQKTNLVSSKL
jgi:hypothetical protein